MPESRGLGRGSEPGSESKSSSLSSGWGGQGLHTNARSRNRVGAQGANPGSVATVRVQPPKPRVKVRPTEARGQDWSERSKAEAKGPSWSQESKSEPGSRSISTVGKRVHLISQTLPGIPPVLKWGSWTNQGPQGNLSVQSFEVGLPVVFTSTESLWPGMWPYHGCQVVAWRHWAPRRTRS